MGYLEARRGSLRCNQIPNPMLWNSLEEWHAAYSTIPFDLPARVLPAHFNADQRWMAQWFETSTLQLGEEGGCWKLMPVGFPTVLVLDGNTGMLVPVYMSLEYGILLANDKYFTTFAQSPFLIAEMWRLEAGNYYRIY